PRSRRVKRLEVARIASREALEKKSLVRERLRERDSRQHGKDGGRAYSAQELRFFLLPYRRRAGVGLRRGGVFLGGGDFAGGLARFSGSVATTLYMLVLIGPVSTSPSAGPLRFQTLNTSCLWFD